MKNQHTTKVSLAIILFFLLCQFQINAQWTRKPIGEKLDKPTSYSAGDIDGDGDEDIAAAIFGQKDIVWYENDGRTLNWNENDGFTLKRHVIDNNLGAVGVFIADLDKDNNNDVVVAGFASNTVKWYRNTGETPVSWTSNVIDDDLSGAEFVYVADIDDDDDLDVVATGATGDCVVWYENDGSLNWTKHIVDDNLDGAVSCQVCNIDGDDTLDIVANGMNDGVLAWYKKGNSENSWEKNTIDTIPGIGNFDITDTNADGYIDIVAASADINDVILYENKGGETLNWNKSIIDGNLGGAFDVDFADIDGDDDMDVVASGKDANVVVWYQNNNQSPDTWDKKIIDDDLHDAWDVLTVDMEGKGYPDVVVNQFMINGNILWYKNPYGEIVHIPDTAFLYALINEGVDTSGDSLISYGESEATISLGVGSEQIRSLEGIESFTNLVYLNCLDNQLSSLDVSSNVALEMLNCNTNLLTSLNVSNNTLLGGLWCSNNNLSSLNVTSNVELVILQCDNNKLTSIDVSNCNSLCCLDISGNLLTSLDISNNRELLSGNCHYASGLGTVGMPSLYEVCVWEGFSDSSIFINTGGSPNVYFTTNCSVTTAKENQLSELSFYPNPTSGKINITGLNSQVHITIYNIDGQLVKSFQHVNNAIDISELETGIYIFYFTSTDKSVVRKLVKD